MRLKANLWALAAASVIWCAAQTALTNDSIIKMVKAGLGEDIVVSTIKSQPGTYSTTADALISLKTAGVGDKIIAAMIEKGSGGGAAPNTPAAPAAQPAASAPP